MAILSTVRNLETVLPLGIIGTSQTFLNIVVVVHQTILIIVFLARMVDMLPCGTIKFGTQRLNL